MSTKEVCKSELVKFHGDYIEVFQDEAGLLVNLRAICINLGVSIQGQLAKLKETSWATCKIILSVAQDGRVREVTAINLDTLNGMLLSLNPKKVRPEVRDKIIVYQREAVKALTRHFHPGLSESEAIPHIHAGPSVDPHTAPSRRVTISQFLETIAHQAECNSQLAATVNRLLDRVESLGGRQAQVASDPAPTGQYPQRTLPTHCKVITYCLFTGRRDISAGQAISVGQIISRTLRSAGRESEILKVPDKDYGSVNTYPITELGAYFGDTPDVIAGVQRDMAEANSLVV
jgi:hypothetical protein